MQQCHEQCLYVFLCLLQPQAGEESLVLSTSQHQTESSISAGTGSTPLKLCLSQPQVTGVQVVFGRISHKGLYVGAASPALGCKDGLAVRMCTTMGSEQVT